MISHQDNGDTIQSNLIQISSNVKDRKRKAYK